MMKRIANTLVICLPETYDVATGLELFHLIDSSVINNVDHVIIDASKSKYVIDYGGEINRLQAAVAKRRSSFFIGAGFNQEWRQILSCFGEDLYHVSRVDEAFSIISQAET